MPYNRTGIEELRRSGIHAVRTVSDLLEILIATSDCSTVSTPATKAKSRDSPLMNDWKKGRRLESMTAADVMTAAPRTCSTFSTVLEAVMIFRDNDCGAVPILDEGKPVATAHRSRRRTGDLRLSRRGQSNRRRNHDPGHRRGRTGRPALEDVCEILRKECVRRTLVVDSAGLVKGIIGWTDIAAVLSDRMMGRVVKDVVAAS